MTVASDGLSVRLTRGFSLEARDADLARAISATPVSTEPSIH